ncbi:MAG: DUF2946 family protein [Pelagimonas sp.]|uniref:DUF2946 family protein n=1 Tax=Pelagimonas sp. TaxID=2073170 RepID=UPI003D6B26B4
MTAAIPTTAPTIRRTAVRSVLLRRCMALVAVFALFLQLFAPNLAKAANLEWIEICSEFGVTMVEVDLSDGPDHPGLPCPDCDACTVCATSLLVVSQDAVGGLTPINAVLDLGYQTRPGSKPENRFLWPVTRAPPSENKTKSDCVFRAFPVSPLKKGEAL